MIKSALDKHDTRTDTAMIIRWFDFWKEGDKWLNSLINLVVNCNGAKKFSSSCYN